MALRESECAGPLEVISNEQQIEMGTPGLRAGAEAAARAAVSITFNNSTLGFAGSPGHVLSETPPSQDQPLDSPTFYQAETTGYPTRPYWVRNRSV